jgi:hypothetical protein
MRDFTTGGKPFGALGLWHPVAVSFEKSGRGHTTRPRAHERTRFKGGLVRGKGEGWSQGDGLPNLDGKTTREDEPATLDL